MDIDQLYTLTQDYKESNYNRTNSPIYQNTTDNSSRSSQETTPIYSNSNIEQFRTSNQGLSYGESLAHHLRHSLGRQVDNTQGNQLDFKFDISKIMDFRTRR